MNWNGRNPLNASHSQVEENTGEDGFTLIETAIALVVMMIVTLAASSLFAYAINYNAGASDRALALALAQQRMERLRKCVFTDASLNSGTATETVTSAGRPYTVETTACTTSDCGGSSVLKVITVRVTPERGYKQWVRTPAVIISERATPSSGPYR